jgi:hypothetical protein
MHNVALAVLNYESARKTFPNGMNTDTKVATPVQQITKFGPNWIIDILPYMEETALRDQFDPNTLKAPYTPGIENGTSAASRNWVARGTPIPSLLCPSDPNNRVVYQGRNGNWARNNYGANTGRAFIHSTAGFSGAANDPIWKDNCQRGVMGVNTAVRLKRITDGTTKTIMLGELRAGITEQDPRGVWALGHAGPSLLARYGSGGDVIGPNYCDVHGDDIDFSMCAGPGLCNTNGANPVLQAECMGCFNTPGAFDQAGVRSKHAGGAFLAMCDGSVTFINDDIETSGCYNNCCTPWDYMIMSGDNGKLGSYNSSSLAGLCSN